MQYPRHTVAQLSVFLILAWFFCPLVYADSSDPGKVIAGWVEKISLKDQSFILKAKLDTGAKTSSIRAENVQKFKRDDRPWVRFNLVLEDIEGVTHTLLMEKPRVRRVRIKTHDGESDRRSIVRLSICFDGRFHETEFSLTERKVFIYPVLLGRSFLEKVAIVDPEHSFFTQASCL